jgi:hypothetical protein
MHTYCSNCVLLLMTPTQNFIPPPFQDFIRCGEPDGRPDEFAISPAGGGAFTACLQDVLTSLVLTLPTQIRLPNQDQAWTVDRIPPFPEPRVSLQLSTRCTPHVLTQGNLFRSCFNPSMDLQSSCGNSSALACETDDSRLVYAYHVKGLD